MITEVSEKNFKKLSFIKRMDAAKGGRWWEDFSKEELTQFRKDMDNEITDDWTAVLTASTIGDAESGKFKAPYADFIARGVKADAIKLEDIYKYKEYFDVFERNKEAYLEKDLGKYVEQGDFSFWRTISAGIKQQEEEDASSAKGVSKKDKYKKLLVHQSNGYSLYKIPEQSKMGGKQDAYYNASCELGSGTEWCTATGRTKQYFDDYTESGALYIFINDEASDEKFQYSPSTNQFMDRFDDDILTSRAAPSILSALKGGLEWIDKNEPGGIGLGVKMAMGAPLEDIKEIFNFYFDPKGDERWIEELWEFVLEDYLKSAQEGEYDNNGVVQKFFKDKQLSPYNINNWLEILKLSQSIFEGFSKYPVHLIMDHFTSIYKLASITHPATDQWTKPYIPLFYEEVIKLGIDEYLSGSTIDFDYKGDLARSIKEEDSLITEVKVEDLEKAFKKFYINSKLENIDIPKDKYDHLFYMYEDSMDEKWKSIVDASTIERTGKIKLNYISFILRYIKAFGIGFNNIWEDMYKFQDYFDVFNRNKRHYEDYLKDLGQIKDQLQFQEWINQSILIKQKEQEDPTTKAGATKAEKIKELFVMEHDGFKMFKIPKQSEMTKGLNYYYEASCLLGSNTEWCTATGKTKRYFNQYTEEGPLFIFVKGVEKFQYAPSTWGFDNFMDSKDYPVYDDPAHRNLMTRWEPFFKKISEITGKPIDVLIKMQMGESPDDLRDDFESILTVDNTHTEYIYSEYVEDFLEEAGNGDWDNDAKVKRFFQSEQLDPFNTTSWLRLLARGPLMYEHLIRGKNPLRLTLFNLIKEVGTDHFGVFHPNSNIADPYLEMFYEEVIKPAIEEMEGNKKWIKIEFEYEGQL